MIRDLFDLPACTCENNSGLMSQFIRKLIHLLQQNQLRSRNTRSGLSRLNNTWEFCYWRFAVGMQGFRIKKVRINEV